MNVAVFSYHYLVERSPVVTGIVQSLARTGTVPVLILDSANGRLARELPGARVVQLIPRVVARALSKFMAATSRLRAVPLAGPRLHRKSREYLASLAWWPCAIRLSTLVWGFDLVYCVEARALFMLRLVGYPMNRCVYVSLELQQLAARFGMRRTGELLETCAMRLIQSPERGNLLNAALGRELTYRYIPVSTLPRTPSRDRMRRDTTMRIVYSGYIAEWSLLREFLIAYRAIQRETNTTFTIHGHSNGTERYLREIQLLVNEVSTACFVDVSMSDRAHQIFLDAFDIGVALYKPATDNDNWRGLLNSSGKIATYLWSGLAVITNIDEPDTREAPFLYMKEPLPQSLTEALSTFRGRSSACAKESLSYAQEHYNVHSYLEPIHAELTSSLRSFVG